MERVCVVFDFFARNVLYRSKYDDLDIEKIRYEEGEKSNQHSRPESLQVSFEARDGASEALKRNG